MISTNILTIVPSSVLAGQLSMIQRAAALGAGGGTGGVPALCYADGINWRPVGDFSNVYTVI